MQGVNLIMGAMPPSQKKWEKENTVCVNIRFSVNQDPELYELFSNAQGNRGTIARELLREALEARKAKDK